MTGEPTAIVTGAARGIGAAIVHRLADTGWRVVAVDSCADDPAVPYPLSTRQQLREVAEARPGAVMDLAADVRDLPALADAVRAGEGRFGPIRAAVAAASVITGGKPLWETRTPEWAPMFDVGVHGVANLARAALPAMLARPEPRGGRFVAVASAAGHHGLWHLSGYSAAKHAVVGMIKSLAHDLRGTGITAAAVSPGSTRTAMLTATAQLHGLDSVEAFAPHQLLGRIVEPREVAAAVAWLCDGDAAVVNGSVVHADGGFVP
ncbi:mycofactocin-coupled SDR family oxidoreductase [Nocardia veterana]|uniref:SDR family oxidoreductase n=1 Tax=Nocardia veterana TaxID=132249 RepID=A0A7X6RKW0_9NOCA|nr:mycofactocin-coupled SDR family oxidoreductase [Nocardia veterana]NKY89600.1 SDR family oxidoreductase [Nocardia veterana]